MSRNSRTSRSTTPAYILRTEGEAGLLGRVLNGWSNYLEGDRPVDIIEFVTSKAYLGQRLYPRQRLLLKLYYKLPLEQGTQCSCVRKGIDPRCRVCGGSGIYNELDDARYLLSAQNRYALLYFPGLCSHSATGESCGREGCHNRRLSDEELRERLLTHSANVLEVIAGRQSGKSILGAFVNCYELYRLLRDPNPQRTWDVIPGEELHTANVATDEDQAKVLYGKLIAMVENSAWFKRQPYRALTTELEFTGRHIFAKSYHSSSKSVRGRTVKAQNYDEFCHFNKTGGNLSDTAIWAALRPSSRVFGSEAKIVITSSPLNKAGVAYDLFNGAQTGKLQNVIAVQMACWEMSPGWEASREHPDIAAEYDRAPEAAEMEYGGQWADQVGVFFPPDAVKARIDAALRRVLRGVKGIRYFAQVDNSFRNDSAALVVGHYDKDTGEVITDIVEEWDPKNSIDQVVNEHGEIDQEELAKYIINLQEQYGFNFVSIRLDQYGAAFLLQRLRRHFGKTLLDGKEVDIVEIVNITDKTNREAYTAARSVVVQGGVRYYHHHSLIQQLCWVAKTIKEGHGGPGGSSGAGRDDSKSVVKIEAPPGHKDDVADAFVYMVWNCLQMAGLIASTVHMADGTRSQLNRHLVSSGNGLVEEGHHPNCTNSYCDYRCTYDEAQAKKKQNPVESKPAVPVVKDQAFFDSLRRKDKVPA